MKSEKLGVTALKALLVVKHFTNGTLILNATCHRIIYDRMLKSC